MNGVSEPFVGFKIIAITLELKLCLSNFSRGIEKTTKKESYKSTSITLIFTRPFDIFLYSIFDRVLPLSKRGCINSLTDSDPTWLLFISWSNFRLNCQIQIKFLRSIPWSFYGSWNVYTFSTHPVHIHFPSDVRTVNYSSASLKTRLMKRVHFVLLIQYISLNHSPPQRLSWS